ncbi:MAG: hypothetical protein ACPG8W_03270 [Candidatus Promineifilaceae bacterium]
MRTRQEIERLIDRVGYNFGQFTIASFIDCLSQTMGRKIFAISCPMPENTFGAWLTDSELPLEYLIVDSGIAGQHAVHVQLHELGHMVLNHRTASVTPQLLQKVLNGKNYSALKHALHRRASRTDDEQEAELFAVIVQERLIAAARNSYLETSSSSDMFQQYFADLGV